MLYWDLGFTIGAVFISGFITWLLVSQSSKGIQIIVFLACMGLFKGVVFPEVISPWLAKRQLEAAFSEMPYLQALKTQEPELYQQWTEKLLQEQQKGASQAQLIALSRQMMERMMLKRLPETSDDAILAFVNALLPAVDELRQHSGDVCYRFLFPQPGEGFNVTRYLSDETLQRNMQAMTKVISEQDYRTALPAQSAIAPYLEKVFAKLRQRYGDSIEAMADPTSAKVSKRKLCDMTYSLYDEVLKLERHQSLALLRTMFAGTSAL